DLDAGIIQGEGMGGRYAEDAVEERAHPVLIHDQEQIGEARLVQAARYTWEHQQRLDLGGKGEEVRGGVVIELLDAEAVAGAKEPVLLSVPDGKGEVAE